MDVIEAAEHAAIVLSTAPWFKAERPSSDELLAVFMNLRETCIQEMNKTGKTSMSSEMRGVFVYAHRHATFDTFHYGIKMGSGILEKPKPRTKRQQWEEYLAKLDKELATRSYSQYDAETAADIRMADVAYRNRVGNYVERNCEGDLW